MRWKKIAWPALAMCVCLLGAGCAPEQGDADRPDAVTEAEPQAEETPLESGMASGSGVEGVATIGPTCPKEEVGAECPTQPFQTELTIREAASGEVAATVNSGADGTFRVDLEPGSYVIEGPAPRLDMEPTARPIEFTVEPGTYVQVELRFDSGIR
jgi:hypothetical protein